MKTVMISIRPEWCEKIASGEKTIEVRKTRPKIEPPFKCYIYCTKQREKTKCGFHFVCTDDLYRLPSGKIKVGYSGELMLHPTENWNQNNFLNCKVIGEFVCDAVFPISVTYSDENSRIALREFPYTGMTDKQIMYYIGNGKTGYGWHISDLAIYDKPLPLSAFRKKCIMPEWPYCPACDVGYEYISETEAEFLRVDGTCNTEWRCLNYLKRPPQSWCYVEVCDEKS